MKLMEPDYNNSILNVSYTILDYYGHKTDKVLIPELKERLDKNYKHVFLMVLDGMGTNIIKKYLRHRDFLKKHMVKKITSVFPPTTVAATNAILTAKSPYENGYLGWTQYFRKEDVYDIVFMNEDYYDSQREIDINLRDKYLENETIFDMIKKSSPDVKIHSVFPDFVEHGFKTFEDEVDEMIRISELDEKTFSYVYWTNPDGIEHQYGPFGRETKENLKTISDKLNQLKEYLGEDSIVVIIADHGQINVKPVEFTKNTFLYDMLDKKPTIEPRCPAFYVKPEKKLDFRMMFRKMYETRYVLYQSNDFIESGLIGSGVKHPMLDDFLGDFVAIAISDSYLKFKDTAIYKGHHAGLTKGEMEVPLIIYEKNK